MSDIKKEIEEHETEVQQQRLAGRLATKEQELTAARTLIRSLTGEVDKLERIHDFLSTPLNTMPKWALPHKKYAKHHGTVGLLLSDLHLDEVVNPAEMVGRNAYNRDIAEMRLRNVFEGVVEQATYYHQGTTYDGALVMLGGDLVSGAIHEELRETNETPVTATIRHWTPQIAAGLEMLGDQFGQVHVSSVSGNHGRTTVKPRYKKRAIDNADWLIGALLAERFANDQRFTFDIPESMDASVDIYDHKFVLTHGDQGSGGSGIGGIWPVIMRLRARKLVNSDFHWMFMGHYHQYVHSQGITVNGSLKGWDEFASGHNFPYEEARQAMFIITPEHGVTWPVELFCTDRKAEGW